MSRSRLVLPRAAVWAQRVAIVGFLILALVIVPVWVVRTLGGADAEAEGEAVSTSPSERPAP